MHRGVRIHIDLQGRPKERMVPKDTNYFLVDAGDEVHLASAHAIDPGAGSSLIGAAKALAAALSDLASLNRPFALPN